MRIYFLLLIVVFTACKSKIPNDVLPPDKMQKVMWDIMLADEMTTLYRNTDSTFNNIAKQARYYQAIFKIHNTTEEVFKNSTRFYTEHPALLKPILDSMNAAGERMNRNIDSIQRLPDSMIRKRNVDSIRRNPVVS